MSSVHTWAGLTLGWILYFIFVTGTASYFRSEIDLWMTPEVPVLEHDKSQVELLDMAERHIAQNAPGVRHWYISFPTDRYPFLGIGWQKEDLTYQVDLMHPQTGELLSPRETGGGEALYEMHFELHYLPQTVAEWLVSIGTMFMFVALITGVIIHKKIFREFFTFRPRKGQRSWLDMHNLLSVSTLPFQLMITYTGLLFFMYETMPAIGAFGTDHVVAAEEPAGDTRAARVSPLSAMLERSYDRWGEESIAWMEVDEPGSDYAHVVVARQYQPTQISESPRMDYDRLTGERNHESERGGASRFYDVVTGLHGAWFAAVPLRWVFFVFGLLGTAMVGTGLMLWASKRRAAAEKAGRRHLGLECVERLNVGTIAGLPIGVAVYFWANRLIPAAVEGRAAMEVNALFLAWALCFVFAVFRPRQKAWFELIALASLLYTLLPILNFLTTERHLGRSIPQGDWVMAGFDLTVLSLGLVFAVGALFAKRAATRQAPGQRVTAQRRRVSMDPKRTAAV
jgi:uncharacterized iron-regulated membrane protein